MRIFRRLALHSRIRAVHEYETEGIPPEISETKQIVFYNGINPMSALAIIDIFPANTLFLLLLIVKMDGSHSPAIVTSATCQKNQILCPCKAI